MLWYYVVFVNNNYYYAHLLHTIIIFIIAMFKLMLTNVNLISVVYNNLVLSF